MIRQLLATLLVMVIWMITIYLNSRQRQIHKHFPLMPRLSNSTTFEVQEDMKNNLNCSISFGDWPNGTRPLVWLTSFPRSGNTWTRHLLELATGIYTGSNNGGKGLYKAGFKGELDDPRLGRAVVYKCHTYKANMNSGILLIRNPYDSLISLYKYCKLQSIVPESYRNNEDWIIWNKRKYVGWLSLIESWFESGKPFLVVHYEEMRKDPLNVIQRMLNFLNITFTNERRQCVRSDIEGKFHRKHKGIFTFDPYTKELHELIDKDIQKANSFLMSINETPIAEPTYNRDL